MLHLELQTKILLNLRGKSIDKEIDLKGRYFKKMGCSEIKSYHKKFRKSSEQTKGKIVKRSISAEVIRNTILEIGGLSSFSREFRIKGAVIRDVLHLEHIKYDGYLRFENCFFINGADLRHTKLRRLKFKNCIFVGVVEADVAEIYGDVEILECVFCNGLSFRAASIGGRFVIDATIVYKIIGREDGSYQEGVALDASMLNVAHGVQLRGTKNKNVKSRPSMIKGVLDLSYANMGANLELKNANICSEKSEKSELHLGIDLTNANLTGFFFIRDNSKITGKINLFNAQIQLFSIDDSVVQCDGKHAIDGEEVTIATSFTIGEGAIIGGLNLLSAKIGGVFQFGGNADESGGMGSKVRSESCNEKVRTKIDGPLNLMYARVGRLAIDFDLWFDHCKSEKEFFPFFRGCVYGDIQGRDTQKLRLEEWVESLYSEPNKTDRDHIHKRHTPQIYHQIVGVLRSKGDEEKANSIEKIGIVNSIKSNAFYSIFREIVSPINLTYYWIIDYRHSVFKLILFAMLYVLFMAWVYLNNYNVGNIIPLNPLIYNSIYQKSESENNRIPNNPCEIGKDFVCLFTFRSYKEIDILEYKDEINFSTKFDENLKYPRQEYSAFHPIWYSLDVFLPLVSFSQENSWAPITIEDKFSCLWFFQILQVIMGWGFSALMIGMLSGLIRHKK